MNFISADPHKDQILVIDNNNNDLKVLSAILTKQGYEVHSLANGSMAVSIAETGWAKLILMDINLGEISGYEICQQLKAEALTQDIPIVFLSASNDPFDKVKAFHVGCSDYITKPFQREEILVRVETQLQIASTQIKLNQLNEQLEKTVQERTAQLEISNQKLQEEIIQRKQAQDRLLKLALNDSITGLPNRNSCLSYLKQALKTIKQKSDYRFAIILIQCDRFQEIKCYLGHLASNQLLMEISRRLSSIITDTDFLGRFENNEFAVVLNNFKDCQEVIDRVKKIQEKFLNPVATFSPIPEADITHQQIDISCSIGIVIGNKNYQTEHNLLQDAEIAVYQATQSEEGSCHLFKSSISSESYTIKQKQDYFQAEQFLREAFKQQKFLVHYQPIFALKSDKIVGLEALLRVQNEDRSLLFPKDFFRTAEITNLSINLGDFIFHQACSLLKLLHQQHESQKDFFMTINLSEKQISHSKLKPKIGLLLKKYDFLINHLNFDLSEQIINNNDKSIKDLLKEFRRSGIKISLDDFASDFEKLKLLDNSLFDNLKIDRALISQIESENNNQKILTTLKNIIDSAHQMHLSVTAEGIETETQLNCLNSLGCDYGQGFFLSKPLAIDALESFLLWRM